MLPGVGYDVPKGKTYTIVFKLTGQGTIGAKIKSTTSDDEDSGSSPWAVFDTAHSRQNEATPDPWTARGGSDAMKIRLYGRERTAADGPLVAGGTPSPSPSSPSPSGSPASAAAVPRPDPSNLARTNPVRLNPHGSIVGLATTLNEISANRPSNPSGSIDLAEIAASVEPQRRARSRSFYTTTQVFAPGQQRSLVRRGPSGANYIVAGENREPWIVAARSPLLLVKIWHVYYRSERGTNSVELLGDIFIGRAANRLAEPVEVCLPAPAQDAERARLGVKGRLDRAWTILETTWQDGQLCAETTRVAWFTIVLEPEPQA